MRANKLTERKVATAKAGTKPVKVADGAGLFLLIQPNGGKYWRWSYRHNGVQRTVAFGTYPDVSLLKPR